MANTSGNGAGDRDGASGASGDDRLTAPPDDARRSRLAFPVIGLGASAGGYEAFAEFLQACPGDTGMAFVLIQHLSPDRESMLVELLGKNTAMPVLEVEDGQPVEPNHVYVIRPGHTLTLQDGHLRLGPELAARGHGRPVDDFFRSLADEQQQLAVAVVFSGMGSNGTAGAQAIKAVGGLVVAQEPESSKYPSMPRSLIDAHLPDYILRPSEVPGALIRFTGQPYVTEDAAKPSPRDEQTLTEVLAVLRTRTRHDFTGYRKPTLLRRVRRRMGLGQFHSMADYMRALRQTPAEVTALADDLLIHVTGFFRDPEAWDALRRLAVDPLVRVRENGAELRCWVSACATGEEAYTLAMVLVEEAEAQGKRFDIKVFATDMAERTLGLARAGIFPNGIESEVTPERLARFFDKDDSFYRVRKDLRELVIFAPQNMLQDPPFSRLDLVTCRNLLIYLEPETQRRVLALLHFGLREGGFLMLGSSESASLADADFVSVEKRHRIYRRVGPTRLGSLNLPVRTNASRLTRLTVPPDLSRTSKPAVVPVTVQMVNRALLDRHTPPAVVIDATGFIVHVHGDTSRYLTLPSGSPTLELMAMANDQVRGALQAALHRASDNQAAATVRDGTIETTGGRRRVEIEVAPLNLRDAPTLYLITFRDYPEPAVVANGDLDDSAPMQAALQQVRDELNGALEEMQSSNEELKAAHEEATSLNEELQSTNEELETSKEEMQSLNEELVTVNAQLQAKMAELETTANDLGSLLTSTDIAVLFLDLKSRIRRFTPAVRDLLDLIPSDVGRPFVDLRLKFADPDLLADARQVLDRLIPIERPVESESGHHYLRRVLPYRTQDNRIDGVVVAFVDVTEQHKSDLALRESQARFEALVRAGANAVYRMSPDWRRMLHLDGVNFLASTTQPTESWLDRYIPPDHRPQVEAAVQRAIRGKTHFDLEHRVIRSDGTTGWTHSRAVPLLDHHGEIWEWFGAASDISARMLAQEALRDSEERYRSLFETMGQGFCELILVRDAAGRAMDQRYLELNPAFERLFGIPIDRAQGRTASEVFPELEPWWHETFDRIARKGEPEQVVAQVAALGRWFEVYVYPRGDDRLTVLFEDVTARKQATLALEASEDRQAFLLALSDAIRPLVDPIAIQVEACRLLGSKLGVDRAYYIELDEPKGVTRVRAEFLSGDSPSLAGEHRIADLGWVIDPMRTGRMLVITDAGNAGSIPKAERQAMAAVRIAAHVNAPLVKQGDLVGAICVTESRPRAWTHAEVELVKETADRIWGAIERARTQAELRAAEDQLRLALKAARMGTWTWDVVADEHHRDANLNALFGEPAEVTVRPFAEFLGHIHPDDRANVQQVFEQSVRQGRPLNIEFRVVWPDGTVHWLRDQGDVFNAAGQVRMTGACIDVTDLKEIEAELRSSEEEFRAATEVVPDLLWRLDLETGDGWVNRRWVEYTGLPNDVVHPRGWLEAVHPDDRAHSREVFERGIEAGVPFRFEYRLRRAADGAYRWFLVGAVPLRDAQQRIHQWFGAVTDIHEQRAARIELEARVAERTEALEREMAQRRDLNRQLVTAQEDERRRVARDLHDSAGQLLVGLSLAFKKVDLAGDIPPEVTAKLAEAQQVLDSLGRELHGLAIRLRPTSLDDLGLETAVRQLIEEWSGRAGVRADFQASGLGPERLPAEIETTLYRVVQEALTNVAKHAAARIVSVVLDRPGDHVKAVIEDDGSGFDPKVIPQGRLGLMGMRERISLVGGDLEIESAPGSGTTIYVRIPLSNRAFPNQ